MIRQSIVLCKYYIYWSMSIGLLLTMIWSLSYYRIIVWSYSCRLLEPCDFLWHFSVQQQALTVISWSNNTLQCVPLFVRCLSVRACKALVKCTEQSMLQQQQHRAQRATPCNASDKHREEHGTRDQKANLRSSCCVLARRRWIKCICQVCAKGSVCVGAVVAIALGGSVLYMSGEWCERAVLWIYRGRAPAQA